ncbi:hypothetical protein M501DRAFT_986877 [Patellaria atrata CBS 101060]|uniref:SMP-30/Gluconolactonase/LRE-like region domain-containing protein n=1 Tax=Patellaria atrata CBS 101060 TaxID=1346257 RepID=A0A9P4S6K4_9PEZI|nr:hypothetical protein M501DRAFT_986877 [Patellaria atrata CBS 101060]
MSEVEQHTITEPWLDVKCELGEGPFWEEATNTLRWIDIVTKHIHTVDLNEGPSSHKSVAQLDISIGSTADIEGNDDEFVFGGKHGYGIFNRKTGEYRYIKKVWTEEEVAKDFERLYRGNDGGVDSQGRYWLGVMNDPLETEFKDVGILFRLDPDLSLHRVLTGVTIPNGISWTKDDKTMYFTDSPTKTIWAYDFDAPTGSISNKRAFYTVEEEGPGVPDGHVLDEEGNLWTALHGVGEVRKISPEGKLLLKISLPTRATTCPVFCGEDLYITSASEHDPEGHPESAKYQGNMFKFHAGVRGAPTYRFKYSGEKI